MSRPEPACLAIAHSAVIEILEHYQRIHGLLPNPRVVVDLAVAAYVWADDVKIPLGGDTYAMPTRNDMVRALSDGTISW